MPRPRSGWTRRASGPILAGMGLLLDIAYAAGLTALSPVWLYRWTRARDGGV